MKRIKQIIEALKVISETPSKTIAGAVMRVMADAHSNTGTTHTASNEDRTLVSKILSAVFAIAEDMEKPAKDSEAKT